MNLETQQMVELRTMRDVRYRVEVRPAEENSSGRILELQTLMALQQNGVPVDPNVIIDYLSLPTDRKDQLRAFLAQHAKAQAAAAQQQVVASERQLSHQAEMDVADRRLDSGGAHPRQVGGLGPVRPGDRRAELGGHAGQPAHASAADADEMDVTNGVFHYFFPFAASCSHAATTLVTAST